MILFKVFFLVAFILILLFVMFTPRPHQDRDKAEKDFEEFLRKRRK